jgi:hypothetical protein
MSFEWILREPERQMICDRFTWFNVFVKGEDGKSNQQFFSKVFEDCSDEARTAALLNAMLRGSKVLDAQVHFHADARAREGRAGEGQFELLSAGAALAVIPVGPDAAESYGHKLQQLVSDVQDERKRRSDGTGSFEHGTALFDGLVFSRGEV